MSKLGTFLRERREWTGKGLIQVAREMGLVDSSYSNIQAWEKGRAVPSLKNPRLPLYAKSLDLGIGELSDVITRHIFPTVPKRAYVPPKGGVDGRDILPLIRMCAIASVDRISLSTLVKLVHLAGEIEASTSGPISAATVDALLKQITN